jgi:hypothetical protein
MFAFFLSSLPPFFSLPFFDKEFALWPYLFLFSRFFFSFFPHSFLSRGSKSKRERKKKALGKEEEEPTSEEREIERKQGRKTNTAIRPLRGST